MKVTILGSGTSNGTPRISGDWGHCDPNQPKNRRRCASIVVETPNTRLLIDTSPDLREQALDAGISDVDAVCSTPTITPITATESMICVASRAAP